MPVTIEQARQAKAKAQDVLRGILVPMTGIGLTQLNGSFAIKVNLRSPVEQQLPQQLDGVPIVYEVTGVAHKRLR
jgi:hypothetical protein